MIQKTQKSVTRLAIDTVRLVYKIADQCEMIIYVQNAKYINRENAYWINTSQQISNETTVNTPITVHWTTDIYSFYGITFL